MTTEIKIVQPEVVLRRAMASDMDVLEAMWVSTRGEDALRVRDDEGDAGIEGRIKFLMANRHGSPFEHNYFQFFVKAPIAVFREHHRHRIGWCLAPETEVWCETISPGCGRTIRKRPIEWLYRNWHEGVTDVNGRTRLLPSCREFTVRTLDESTGHFILSKVVDIYRNGVKPVLRMTTERGESIRASADHAIWTPEGWAKIGDLTVGELVGRNSKVSTVSGRQVPPSLRRGIGVWTSMQRAASIKPVDVCYSCGELFDADDLILDHVVPVVIDLQRALDPNNLAPMCDPCHRAKTDTEQALASRGQTAGVGWTKIASIEPDGEVETYDIELEGPNRGFVANGLVVHNSYNEESGRYSVMKPEFYIPPPERPLVQTGKPGAYVMSPGTYEQHEHLSRTMVDQFQEAYDQYKVLLANGITREVARGVLPVYLMTSMVASCNARSMMAFLSLRTDEPESTFPSKPMWEIDRLVARVYEQALAEHMPITYKAFNDAGRVSP